MSTENEESTKGLYDAVDAAIDEVTPATKVEEKTDEPEIKDQVETEVETEAAAEAGATTSDVSDDDTPAGDAAEDDAPVSDTSKDAAPKEEPEDEPKPDPVNDPIPETLHDKTKERIQSLIEIARERTVEAEQGREIVDTIQAAGVDADQFANTLNFLKLYNSSDTTQRKAALEAARGVVRELALELGEGASVVKLESYPDLIQDLENNAITEERALEIAANRDKAALDASRVEAQRDKSNSESETQQLIQNGRNQLNIFENSMRTADPVKYNAIRPAFIRVLTPILRRTHPSEYGAVAKEIYDQLATAVPVVQPKPTTTAPPVQPLRPKGDGGGSNNKEAEPKNAAEAMERALAAL